MPFVFNELTLTTSTYHWRRRHHHQQRHHHNPTTQAQQQQRYRNFTLHYKLHIVNYALTHNIRATSAHFGIDRKVVRGWVRSRGSYGDQTQRQTRLREQRVEQFRYPGMENALERFIQDQQALGHFVTGGMIRVEAVRLVPGTNFSASNGWL